MASKQPAWFIPSDNNVTQGTAAAAPHAHARAAGKPTRRAGAGASGIEGFGTLFTGEEDDVVDEAFSLELLMPRMAREHDKGERITSIIALTKPNVV
jgi:hypothetical protein